MCLSTTVYGNYFSFQIGIEDIDDYWLDRNFKAVTITSSWTMRPMMSQERAIILNHDSINFDSTQFNVFIRSNGYFTSLHNLDRHMCPHRLISDTQEDIRMWYAYMINLGLNWDNIRSNNEVQKHYICEILHLQENLYH